MESNYLIGIGFSFWFMKMLWKYLGVIYDVLNVTKLHTLKWLKWLEAGASCL
jgi:hypothetical protein